MNDQNRPSKALNVSLWIVQVLVGALFIMTGVTKTFQPIDVLGQSLPWVNEVSAGMVRFIGISQLLGGVGVLAPSVLRIKPKLTPLAAAALAVVMALAFFYHIVKDEYDALGVNALLAAMSLFIAWGRFKKAPIVERK